MLSSRLIAPFMTRKRIGVLPDSQCLGHRDLSSPSSTAEHPKYAKLLIPIFLNSRGSVYVTDIVGCRGQLSDCQIRGQEKRLRFRRVFFPI